MGCDIHSFAEAKKNGKWERNEDPIFAEGSEPFGWRSYGLFGFLADVRNYSQITPISETRGLPSDSEWLNSEARHQGPRSYWTETPVMIETNYDDIHHDMNYHSHSYLTLKELLDFDYSQTFWDRRISRTTRFPGGGSLTNGRALAEEGEGEIISYRDFLSEGFFKELNILCTLGNPDDVRIVFWFDN